MWRTLLLSLLLIPLLALLASAEIERNPGSRSESGLGDPRGAGKGHPPQHVSPVEQATTAPAPVPEIKALTLAELGQAKLIIHGCRSAGRSALRSARLLAASQAQPPTPASARQIADAKGALAPAETAPEPEPEPQPRVAEPETAGAEPPPAEQQDAAPGSANPRESAGSLPGKRDSSEPAGKFLDELAQAGERAEAQAAASGQEVSAQVSDELLADSSTDSAEPQAADTSAPAAGSPASNTAAAPLPVPENETKSEKETQSSEPDAHDADNQARAEAPSREIRSRTHPGEDNARGRSSVDQLLNNEPGADKPDSPADPVGQSGADRGAASAPPSEPAEAQPGERDRYPNSGEDALRPEAARGGDAWERGKTEVPPAAGAGKPGDDQRALDPETLLDELDQQAPGAKPETAPLEAPKLERELVFSSGSPAAGAGILNAQLGAAAPVNLALPVERPSMPDYTLPSGLSSIARGNHKQKTVALTFDDGPHPLYTSQILAVLEHYQVPATFFFVGLQAQKYPQWVKMAHQGGHEIGSHTYDHFRLPKLPPAEQAYQIDEYQRLVEGLIGVTPRFLRPPGGQIDKGTEQLLQKRGMVAAMWDVALNDTSNGKTGSGMLKATLKKVRNGSIILAHDGIQATVDLLPELITTLRNEGYTFVTMSELASGL